jgi:hypothetical protein
VPCPMWAGDPPTHRQIWWSACSGGIDNGLTFARGVALTTVAAVSALRALDFTSVALARAGGVGALSEGKKRAARVRDCPSL